MANYITTDNTIETPDAYALCYKCHDRNVLMNLRLSGFRLHTKHIQQEDAPCSVCHDAHGIGATQGDYANNRARININTAMDAPNSAGNLYCAGGTFSRKACALLSHRHNAFSNVLIVYKNTGIGMFSSPENRIQIVKPSISRSPLFKGKEKRRE